MHFLCKWHKYRCKDTIQGIGVVPLRPVASRLYTISPTPSHLTVSGTLGLQSIPFTYLERHTDKKIYQSRSAKNIPLQSRSATTPLGAIAMVNMPLHLIDRRLVPPLSPCENNHSAASLCWLFSVGTPVFKKMHFLYKWHRYKGKKTRQISPRAAMSADGRGNGRSPLPAY